MDPEHATTISDSLDMAQGRTDTPARDGPSVSAASLQTESTAARAKSAQQSIVVDCGLPEVFAFACDFAKRCQWQRGTLIVQLAQVAELGARCTEARSAHGGSTEEWNLQVVAFERDSLLTIRAERDSAEVVERHVFALDPWSARRTRYTLSLETSGTRWTAGDLQRQIVDRLIHFRDCVERPDTMAASQRWAATRLRRKGDEVDPTAMRRQATEGGSSIGPED
jgi:hypothetical protein